MDIAPPFGYKEIVPLLKTHKVRLLKPGEVPPFVRDLNAIPISFMEFARVALTYPIVFTSGDKGETYAPVAVLGIQGGENLFVIKDAWAASTYVPAYARRFPFCMARVTLDKVEQKDRLICIEKEFAGMDNVTIYTILFPIDALHPAAAQKSRQIWCASDRLKAWDEWFANNKLPDNKGDCANPVAELQALGAKLKINATPTLIFADGTMVPGALPLAQLESTLARAEAEAKKLAAAKK